MSLSREAALALLGLSGADPTDAEVNAAYKAIMQMNHPDRYAGNERLRKHAEEQSKLINEARDVLLNGARERAVRSEAPSDASAEGRSGAVWRAEDFKGTERAAWGADADSSSFRGSCADGRQSASTATSDPLPLLDSWVTPVGASAAGIFAQPLLLSLLEGFFSNAAWVVDLLEVVIIVLSLAYAIVVYPSYFTRAPKMTSSASVAFWNCAFGGIVFGLIWNANLTKQTKGKSYIVFCVLVGLRIVIYCAGVLAAVMYLSLAR